jgi:CheY-like chemotaxis protein
MEELLRRLIGENIRLVTILGSGVGNIKADPNQIEQVIMNLAVNARDAMPGGGRVIIETRPVHIAPVVPQGSGVRITGATPGDYVLLSVSDTGCGMDAATASRIFEPFFTTKELGRGTGLGLSTVFGIVEQSGGLITVESAPGAGSTFRMYLPVKSGTAERPAAAKATDNRARRAGSILLVEDEAPLRRLVMKVLTGAGYKVLEAVNGDEALALAARHSSIDLVLTDVVMPGLSGPDLATRLLTDRPGLVVLFMSGYDRELIDNKSTERAASFLPKPFTPRALLEKIGELIGADHGGAAGGTPSTVG